MNRLHLIEDIYRAPITDKEKIKQLNDLLLDLKNEMDAVDQNMHPELHVGVSEAYRIARQYLRELEEDK